MKKIIALLSALTMITAFVGCESEEGTSSNTTEITTSTTVNQTVAPTEAIDVELDKTEKIEDMSLLSCSEWIYSKDDANNLWYQNDGGFMTIYISDLGSDLSSFSKEDKTTFQEDFFKSSYETAMSSDDMKNCTQRNDILVDEESAITFNCEIDNIYVNNVIVLFGDKSYSIGIVEKRNGKETIISKYADQIIESIKFDRSKPAQAIVTTDSVVDLTETETNNITLGMKNAVETAKRYIKTIPFSYTELIEQLEYEKYSHEEAVYGADNCGADWNEQAVLSAKSYIKTSAFSYSGLIGQLEYEGFTNEEAVYGADNCGADWKEQAAKCAENYINSFSFSRQELLDQLLYEEFTAEEAEYGVSAVGY